MDAETGDAHVPYGRFIETTLHQRYNREVEDGMAVRKVTLTLLVAVAAIAVAIAQGREGGGQGRQGGAQGQQGSAQGRQGAAPPAQLTIQQVKPGLYAILNPGANTLAVRVTNEGVILVDDMFAQNYEQILALIKSVTDQPVKYVISTHHHGDHTGGNAQFLKTAQIIGHKNARAAMTGANPLPGAPPLTLIDEAGINLGGAEVQLHHVGRGHTNGDTIRSEEHTSELQSPCNLVCRLLLEK